MQTETWLKFVCICIHLPGKTSHSEISLFSDVQSMESTTIFLSLKYVNYRSCLLLKNSYGKWHGVSLISLWLTCHLGQETPSCQSHSQFPFQVSFAHEMEWMIKGKRLCKRIDYSTLYLVLFCFHLQYMYLLFLYINYRQDYQKQMKKVMLCMII